MFIETDICKSNGQLSYQFNFEINYDDQVLKELYENTGDHFIKIDNIKYPIFQKTNKQLICLICESLPLVNSIKDHVKIISHKQTVGCSTFVERFKMYHNFWMNQETHIQMEQKFFRQNHMSVNCVCCDKELNYNEVLTHIESDHHKKSFAPLLIRQLDATSDSIELEKYNGLVVETNVKRSPVRQQQLLSAEESQKGIIIILHCI